MTVCFERIPELYYSKATYEPKEHYKYTIFGELRKGRGITCIATSSQGSWKESCELLTCCSELKKSHSKF